MGLAVFAALQDIDPTTEYFCSLALIQMEHSIDFSDVVGIDIDSIHLALKLPQQLAVAVAKFTV